LLAADAMATVHAMSGSRSRFVIGRGDGAMKVLQRAPMPVGEFEIYLRRLQSFLRREEVEIDGAVSSMSRLDDIDPSLRADKPDVSVAATGPRMIAAAARWADGIDFSVGANPAWLRQCIALAREACHAAGRRPETLSLGCYVQVAVIDPDDETASARAREAVRGLIVTHARFSGNFSGAAAAAMAPVLSATRGGIERTAGGKPGELDFYPKDALVVDEVERFGVLGSAQECAERLAELAALGLRHIYIGTRSVGVDLEERNTLRVGREVLPRVRQLTLGAGNEAQTAVTSPPLGLSVAPT
jgi:5,10-methylenetetrahydromethanopterin reductase